MEVRSPKSPKKKVSFKVTPSVWEVAKHYPITNLVHKFGQSLWDIVVLRALFAWRESARQSIVTKCVELLFHNAQQMAHLARDATSAREPSLFHSVHGSASPSMIDQFHSGELVAMSVLEDSRDTPWEPSRVRRPDSASVASESCVSSNSGGSVTTMLSSLSAVVALENALTKHAYVNTQQGVDANSAQDARSAAPLRISVAETTALHCIEEDNSSPWTAAGGSSVATPVHSSSGVAQLGEGFPFPSECHLQRVGFDDSFLLECSFGCDAPPLEHKSTPLAPALKAPASSALAQRLLLAWLQLHAATAFAAWRLQTWSSYDARSLCTWRLHSHDRTSAFEIFLRWRNSTESARAVKGRVRSAMRLQGHLRCSSFEVFLHWRCFIAASASLKPVKAEVRERSAQCDAFEPEIRDRGVQCGLLDDGERLSPFSPRRKPKPNLAPLQKPENPPIAEWRNRLRARTGFMPPTLPGIVENNSVGMQTDAVIPAGSFQFELKVHVLHAWRLYVATVELQARCLRLEKDAYSKQEKALRCAITSLRINGRVIFAVFSSWRLLVQVTRSKSACEKHNEKGCKLRVRNCEQRIYFLYTAVRSQEGSRAMKIVFYVWLVAHLSPQILYRRVKARGQMHATNSRIHLFHHDDDSWRLLTSCVMVWHQAVLRLLSLRFVSGSCARTYDKATVYKCFAAWCAQEALSHEQRRRVGVLACVFEVFDHSWSQALARQALCSWLCHRDFFRKDSRRAQGLESLVLVWGRQRDETWIYKAFCAWNCHHKFCLNERRRTRSLNNVATAWQPSYNAPVFLFKLLAVWRLRAKTSIFVRELECQRKKFGELTVSSQWQQQQCELNIVAIKSTSEGRILLGQVFGEWQWYCKSCLSALGLWCHRHILCAEDPLRVGGISGLAQRVRYCRRAACRCNDSSLRRSFAGWCGQRELSHQERRRDAILLVALHVFDRSCNEALVSQAISSWRRHCLLSRMDSQRAQCLQSVAVAWGLQSDQTLVRGAFCMWHGHHDFGRKERRRIHSVDTSATIWERLYSKCVVLFRAFAVWRLEGKMSVFEHTLRCQTQSYAELILSNRLQRQKSALNIAAVHSASEARILIGQAFCEWHSYCRSCRGALRHARSLDGVESAWRRFGDLAGLRSAFSVWSNCHTLCCEERRRGGCLLGIAHAIDRCSRIALARRALGAWCYDLVLSRAQSRQTQCLAGVEYALGRSVERALMVKGFQLWCSYYALRNNERQRAVYLLCVGHSFDGSCEEPFSLAQPSICAAFGAWCSHHELSSLERRRTRGLEGFAYLLGRGCDHALIRQTFSSWSCHLNFFLVKSHALRRQEGFVHVFGRYIDEAAVGIAFVGWCLHHAVRRDERRQVLNLLSTGSSLDVVCDERFSLAEPSTRSLFGAWCCHHALSNLDRQRTRDLEGVTYAWGRECDHVLLRQTFSAWSGYLNFQIVRLQELRHRQSVEHAWDRHVGKTTVGIAFAGWCLHHALYRYERRQTMSLLSAGPAFETVCDERFSLAQPSIRTLFGTWSCHNAVSNLDRRRTLDLEGVIYAWGRECDHALVRQSFSAWSCHLNSSLVRLHALRHYDGLVHAWGRYIAKTTVGIAFAGWSLQHALCRNGRRRGIICLSTGSKFDTLYDERFSLSQPSVRTLFGAWCHYLTISNLDRRRTRNLNSVTHAWGRECDRGLGRQAFCAWSSHVSGFLIHYIDETIGGSALAGWCVYHARCREKRQQGGHLLRIGSTLRIFDERFSLSQSSMCKLFSAWCCHHILCSSDHQRTRDFDGVSYAWGRGCDHALTRQSFQAWACHYDFFLQTLHRSRCCKSVVLMWTQTCEQALVKLAFATWCGQHSDCRQERWRALSLTSNSRRLDCIWQEHSPSARPTVVAAFSAWCRHYDLCRVKRGKVRALEGVSCAWGCECNRLLVKQIFHAWSSHQVLAQEKYRRSLCLESIASAWGRHIAMNILSSAFGAWCVLRVLHREERRRAVSILCVDSALDLCYHSRLSFTQPWVNAAFCAWCSHRAIGKLDRRRTLDLDSVTYVWGRVNTNMLVCEAFGAWYHQHSDRLDDRRLAAYAHWWDHCCNVAILRDYCRSWRGLVEQVTQCKLFRLRKSVVDSHFLRSGFLERLLNILTTLPLEMIFVFWRSMALQSVGRERCGRRADFRSLSAQRALSRLLVPPIQQVLWIWSYVIAPYSENWYGRDSVGNRHATEDALSRLVHGQVAFGMPTSIEAWRMVSELSPLQTCRLMEKAILSARTKATMRIVLATWAHETEMWRRQQHLGELRKIARARHCYIIQRLTELSGCQHILGVVVCASITLRAWNEESRRLVQQRRWQTLHLRCRTRVASSVEVAFGLVRLGDCLVTIAWRGWWMVILGGRADRRSTQTMNKLKCRVGRCVNVLSLHIVESNLHEVFTRWRHELLHSSALRWQNVCSVAANQNVRVASAASKDATINLARRAFRILDAYTLLVAFRSWHASTALALEARRCDLIANLATARAAGASAWRHESALRALGRWTFLRESAFAQRCLDAWRSAATLETVCRNTARTMLRTCALCFGELLVKKLKATPILLLLILSAWRRRVRTKLMAQCLQREHNASLWIHSLFFGGFLLWKLWATDLRRGRRGERSVILRQRWKVVATSIGGQLASLRKVILSETVQIRTMSAWRRHTAEARCVREMRLLEDERQRITRELSVLRGGRESVKRTVMKAPSPIKALRNDRNV